MSDPVNHPAHYGGRRPRYEAIKVIEAWELDFHLGNAVKYVRRSGSKGNELEDLQKAAWYLNRKVALLEAQLAAEDAAEAELASPFGRPA